MKVAGFEQEILIGQEFVGAVGDKVLVAAQRERWNPGRVIRKIVPPLATKNTEAGLLTA